MRTSEARRAALQQEALQVVVGHDGLEGLELIDQPRPQLVRHRSGDAGARTVWR